MTAANAYHRHVADLHLGLSGNLETILRHVSSTFHAHDEVPEMAHHQLARHTLTRLLLLHQHHLFAADSVVVAAGVISSFVEGAVAGGTWTIVTYSDETALLLYLDGHETRERFLARLVNQKGGKNDASTDEMRNADPSGLIESAMSNAQEEIRHSLVSRTGHPMIRWQVEPRIRHQHRT